MKSIHARELNDNFNHGILLDVRTAAEFEEVHIPGSRLMPLHELDPQKVKDMGGSRVALICRSGNRAKQAAEKLEAAGLGGVEVLEGGVMAWDEAGLPVKRGKKSISIERQVRIGAGVLIVTGVVLGTVVNPWFLLLSGFVACGLIFAGLTDWCGMGLILARMPWNNRGGSCSAEGGATCAR